MVMRAAALVFSLLIASGFAQVVKQVDICDLFQNPAASNREMIQVRALVDPGFGEGGPWLSGEQCSAYIEVKGTRFPNLISIEDPEERLVRLHASGFEWSASDRTRFYDMLQNADTIGEVVRATIVGRFETRTALREQNAAPAQILVRSVAEMVEEKPTEPWPHRFPERARQQREFWLTIKRALTASNGMEYFETSFKGAMIPGGAAGFNRLRGTIVANSPDQRAVVLALADASTPEVKLLLTGGDTAGLRIGSTIEFAGIPTEFRGDPFMLVFDVPPGKWFVVR